VETPPIIKCSAFSPSEHSFNPHIFTTIMTTADVRGEKPMVEMDEKELRGASEARIAEDARLATVTEHEMGFLRAMKHYRKAVFWSVCVSLATIMEGYDNSLIGSFYGLPAFQKQFGIPYAGPPAGYQLEAKWQTALGLASPIGFIIGLFTNGYLVERFGYRRVMLPCYFFTTAFIFVVFFAKSPAVLLVGELLSAITFGVFGGLAPGYAAEVCPTVLRSYLTMYVNVTFVLGQIISAGVILGMVNITTQWAYKIPFAIQWVWPVPLFSILYFAPESPWWLVRRGRLEEAERTIQRLSSDSMKNDAKNTVAMMLHTDNHEKEITAGATYLNCFRKTDLRRTEIACVAWMTQQLQSISGLGGSYFYEQLGISVQTSYALNFGNSAISLVGTFTAWALVGRVGRRTIYLYGVGLIAVFYFIVGFMALSPNATSSGIKWGQAGVLLVQSYTYSVSTGPLAFTIASETGSTRLRAKTIALARSSYYASSVVASSISPFMINPTQGNWKGKAGFLNGGVTFLCFLWCYFRLVECKGRTCEELDILFERRVPARKFAKYRVDAFTQDENEVIQKVEN